MNSSIRKLFNDIRTVKIQGATNVAEATVQGMVKFARESGENNASRLLGKTLQIGKILSTARENEPLARNAVVYIENKFRKNNVADVDDVRLELVKYSDEFFEMLKMAKRGIVDNGVDLLQDTSHILTHCHSSTAENILKGLSIINKDLSVVATETRPLYQGRITSKHLIEAGIDTTLIVDDSVAQVIVSKKDSFNIEAVLIGCDELSYNGTLINKIGSFQVALAAKLAKIPVYVATTLLKINLDWDGDSAGKEVETRSSKEVWPDAPRRLKIYNPAFDIVSQNYIAGYITEAGVLDSEMLKDKLAKLYNWAL